ncbi:acyltransferase family protein [Novosphingobium bradum]|uniref:Acyltransferase family protein n=1 Tax=Novosphingobium bradum TaxID=1737444 RepID=A0ABV7ISL8_9SPHN
MSAGSVAPARSVHHPDLDGLRGALALGVALLHLGINSFTMRALGWKGPVLGLGVDVFFVLSGYVLTRATAPTSPLGLFALRRFLRLAPVFYVTTLGLALVIRQSPESLETVMGAPVMGRDPLNFPAWSICWEFYLPLLALGAANLGLRVPDKAVRPLLALCLVALGLVDREVAAGGNQYLMRALFGLAAGHLLWRSRLALPVRLEIPFVVLIGAMALAPDWPGAAVVLPFAAAACVLAGVHGGSVFGSAPFQFLGTISYTLYLVHVPVLRAAQAVLSDGVNANPPVKLAVLVASLILAWLLTVAVERPFIRLGGRLKALATAGAPQRA